MRPGIRNISHNLRALWDGLRAFLHSSLRLRLGADPTAVDTSMRDLIAIQNDRLWFLAAAAVIASVGLNTDSAAVVIGAMLVSPLMGPLVGLGYAMAVYDKRLAATAIHYLGISVVFSLAVSAFYFAVTPLDDVTGELLARTRPNLLDLVVAVAAASAGVIAIAGRDLSATVPGVAIATAIMPPLCTAGYGIATGQWNFAAGAFYLFVVNAVAIVLSSRFLFRRMKLIIVAQGSEARASRWAMAGLMVVFLLPLTFALWNTATENRQAREARQVVEEVSERYGVASWKFNPGKHPALTMFLFGNPGTTETSALARALEVRLPQTRIDLRTTLLPPEVKETIQKLESSVIDSTTALREIQSTVAEQSRRMEKVAAWSREDTERIANEWRLLDERIGEVLFYRPVEEDGRWMVRVEAGLPDEEARVFSRRWAPWLTLRTGHHVDIVLVRRIDS